ncbi:hypothetical protein U0C82_11755 [Fulvimarina sp. 2208YS6-2-32]|uniref:Uncharacterized protein n=1 Tax=Fulvimarina uroteuthidis TaxID=3098149 RepID=A0ABU5I389_9HYPH|nr:hypothetical protein [Fulvimarina sp. 2208YS6-2-32]MDY8109813.1 hypothetical protein [Fulvimarina sp. 2208YS6-2-32]
MTSPPSTGAAGKPATFIPIDEYRRPPLPTEETFRRLYSKILAMVQRSKPDPIMAEEQLQKATLELLDDVVAPPAAGPVIGELQATLGPWLAEKKPVRHIATIVLPPCDENGIIETWARRHGHGIVEAPARGDLLSSFGDPVLPDLTGEGPLVIPRLERWFLRHRDGLKTVRGLLAAIDVVDRQVVVGCNSWAFEFLSMAVGANMILPEGKTFQAFDEMRLYDWISELSQAEESTNITFRLPQNGKNVMDLDEDGTLRADTFKTLAGRSLGIPWVAWHMWRRSLRLGSDPDLEIETDADGRSETDEQVLWVAALDEYVLPADRDQTVLLVLHALILHGGLTADELRLVLPSVGESNVVSALISAGFVQRHDTLLKCRAAAYPAIREGLMSAGFPMDRL